MVQFNFEEIIAKINDIASEGTPESAVIKKHIDALKDRYGKSDDPLPTLAAPNYADLWYLFNHVNMMTYVEGGGEDKEYTEKYFTNRLKFFKEKLGGMRPMRGITPTGEITYVWLTKEVPDIKSFLQKAKPWIQLLAFEIVFKDQKFRYGTELKPPKDVVGYIMFPVGQAGIMEAISLVRETDTEADTFVMKDDEKPVVTSGGAFPPTEKWIANKCYGRQLITKLYLIPDAEKNKVFTEPQNNTTYSTEYRDEWHPNYMKISNTRIQIPIEEIYGMGKDASGKNVPGVAGKNVDPKGWMRVWITREEKWPIPGEFIGIICKPCPVPPHLWWEQESSPFVYAGNWVDTWDLSSGVITEVTADQTHPTTKSSCTKYKVRYHGEECYVYSSDYLEYEVKDRVGIVKLGTHILKGSSYEDSFTMKEQQEIGDISPTKDTPQVTEDLVILPITYYKEG